LLLLIPLAGCSLPAPKPPNAEFLVADGSSTYWVRSGPGGINSRTSPLILTSADSRFYEVYVEEVTRSYEDAIFTREPIYSRDLLTGRKKILYEDSKVTAWEKMYLTGNPKARLLDPDEDGGDDVSVAATGESDIVGVAGPYVLYNRRITLEKSNFQQSDSSRGAIDIRSRRKRSNQLARARHCSARRWWSQGRELDKMESRRLFRCRSIRYDSG
jgi:hypothetical protein